MAPSSVDVEWPLPAFGVPQYLAADKGCLTQNKREYSFPNLSICVQQAFNFHLRPPIPDGIPRISPQSVETPGDSFPELSPEQLMPLDFVDDWHSDVSCRLGPSDLICTICSPFYPQKDSCPDHHLIYNQCVGYYAILLLRHMCFVFLYSMFFQPKQ